MTPYILSLIMSWSSFYNIEPELAMNVIRVESNYKQDAIGNAGELGLFQLLPQSFPKYTKSQLLNPKINIKLGIKYLAEVKKYCKHKIDYTFIICYNRGVFGGNKVKNPYNNSYYLKVIGNLDEERTN